MIKVVVVVVVVVVFSLLKHICQVMVVKLGTIPIFLMCYRNEKVSNFNFVVLNNIFYYSYLHKVEIAF